MAQGVVKSYDPNTGNGIVILDTDKTEVFLAPGSLKGSIFRTLRQGQRVNFDIEQREEIPTIVNIRIGQDLESTINQINSNCFDPTLESDFFMTLTSRKKRAEELNEYKLSHIEGEEELIKSKEV